jgi:hypothetical protein
MTEPEVDLIEVTCRNLRNKKMSYLPLVEALRESDQSGSGHCWCRATGTALGPDGARVALSFCRVEVGRGCFESIDS